MSRFKKEVEKFVEESREFQTRIDKVLEELAKVPKRRDVVIKGLKEIIARQQKEIDELHDKLLARDLPELKTFRLPDFESSVTYNPEEDESLAGEVVADMEALKEGRGG